MGKKKPEERRRTTFRIPRDWRERCKKDKKWCAWFLQKVREMAEIDQLFSHRAPPKLTKAEMKEIDKECKKIPKGKKHDDCIMQKRLLKQVEVFNAKGKGKGAKRAANEGKDSGSTGEWIAVGALLLLLLAALAAYFFWFRGKKEKGGPTKGKGKASKSKLSGKSK